MSHATAARKHRKAPDPLKAIAIALSEVGAAKRSRVSHNWRHAHEHANPDDLPPSLPQDEPDTSGCHESR